VVVGVESHLDWIVVLDGMPFDGHSIHSIGGAMAASIGGAMATIKLVLMDERPISLNKFYSGDHWAKRAAEVKRVKGLMRSVLTGEETPYQALVNIRVTAFFDKRPLDSSNIAAKLYEDALKGWLIVDDTLRYVASMTTASRIDKDRPRVEIEIAEVEA